jgi:hypothetical protein
VPEQVAPDSPAPAALAMLGASARPAPGAPAAGVWRAGAAGLTRQDVLDRVADALDELAASTAEAPASAGAVTAVVEVMRAWLQLADRLAPAPYVLAPVPDLVPADEPASADLQQRVSPMPGQVLAEVEFADYVGETVKLGVETERANVITSATAADATMHRPVIDLDMPAQLLPSGTKGHHHLLVDKEMSWEQYSRLLAVLAEVGLVEPGYTAASLQRGFSCVRLPWVRK